MELLRWKTRLAVLWIILAVGFSAYVFLRFMEPGFIEGIISGRFGSSQISEGYLFYLAIFWFIPWIMAFLTLTLKDSVNRWTNLILGIIFTLLNIWHFLGCGLALIENPIGEPTALHILLVGSTVVATALIAWFAWKWPED